MSATLSKNKSELVERAEELEAKIYILREELREIKLKLEREVQVVQCDNCGEMTILLDRAGQMCYNCSASWTEPNRMSEVRTVRVPITQWEGFGRLVVKEGVSA